MANELSAEAAYIVKDGDDYYVVTSAKKYSRSGTTSGGVNSQSYGQIEHLFNSLTPPLVAKRVDFEVSTHSAHSGRIP